MAGKEEEFDMRKFKVGDIIRSRENSTSIYCIFRIEPNSNLGILADNGAVWSNYPDKIFYKIRSTKKRKKIFLEEFKEKLFSGDDDRFNNLDYVDVVEALKHGSKRTR
jgi:hypothetical protein